jgi:hypothetical protein
MFVSILKFKHAKTLQNYIFANVNPYSLGKFTAHPLRWRTQPCAPC